VVFSGGLGLILRGAVVAFRSEAAAIVLVVHIVTHRDRSFSAGKGVFVSGITIAGKYVPDMNEMTIKYKFNLKDF